MALWKDSHYRTNFILTGCWTPSSRSSSGWNFLGHHRKPRLRKRSPLPSTRRFFFFFFLVLLRHWGGMWGECRSVALTAPLEWRDLSLRIAKQSSALFCVVICLFTLPLVFCFGSCPFSTHVPSLVVSFVVSWFSDLFSLHPLISLHISTLLF